MFAEPDGIDSDRVGQYSFRDHVADYFGMRFEAAVGSGRNIAEGIEAEFDLLRHVLLACRLRKALVFGVVVAGRRIGVKAGCPET